MMSEYQNQKATKPKVEDSILALVKEDQKQAALEFIATLRSCKMTPAWATTNAWKYHYKGKRVGYFRINEEGDWLLSIYTQYDRHLNDLVSEESEDIKAFVNKQTEDYVPCGGCMPGMDRRTVTKKFANICACSAINLKNPDETYREFANRLLELRREAILDDRVPKCNYVKPADRT